MSGAQRPLDVAVIGAGFAGLGAAIRLRRRGITDIAILERDTRVGGTWRDNTYPGAACDIPSRLYSYSFAPNPDWSRTYSGSAEILGYIEAMVERFGLRRHLRFGHNVTGLVYDESAGEWSITVDGHERPLRARAVVLASGPLSNAGLPDIDGRGGRHRGQRRADHPRTGRPHRRRHRLPADTGLGAAAGRPRHR